MQAFLHSGYTVETILKLLTDASPFVVMALVALWLVRLSNSLAQGRNNSDSSNDKLSMSLIQLIQNAQKQTEATQRQSDAIIKSTEALRVSVDAQIDFDKQKTQVLEALHRSVLGVPDTLKPSFDALKIDIGAGNALLAKHDEHAAQSRLDILAAIATVPEALRAELVPMLAALSELTELARVNRDTGVTLVTSIRAMEMSIHAVLNRFPLVSTLPLPPKPPTLAETSVTVDKPSDAPKVSPTGEKDGAK